MPISMLSDSAMDVAALWAKVLELCQSDAYVVYISHTQFITSYYIRLLESMFPRARLHLLFGRSFPLSPPLSLSLSLSKQRV